MSYDIVYAKKFIKLSNGVILPLILSGSNNCFMFSNETGKEIPERDWRVFNGFLDKTGDEIIAWAYEKVKSGKKSSEWFVENAKWITNETIVPWFKNCIKKASCIEDILYANPSVRLSAFVSIFDSSKKWGEEGCVRIERNKSSLKTTKEIENMVKVAKTMSSFISTSNFLPSNL